MANIFTRKPLEYEGVLFDGNNIQEVFLFAIEQGYTSCSLHYEDGDLSISIARPGHEIAVAEARPGSALVFIKEELDWFDKLEVADYWEVDKAP